MCFKGVKKKFNGCLRKVSKAFQGSFKWFSIWRGVPRDLEGSFTGIKKTSKGVSRPFQRHFKEVLGVSSVF